MATCTYDNPATMARECWQDKTLVCHYIAQILPPYIRGIIPAEHFFFGANVGPWKLGQMVGDEQAIPPHIRPFQQCDDFNMEKVNG